MLATFINYDDFQYVIERQKPHPVCFGSGLERDTNPIGKGLSPYQRRFAAEIHAKVTPQTYHLENLTSGVAILKNKVRSNKGVGGLANKAPRFYQKLLTRIPSPTRYDPEPLYKIFKPNTAPFGQKSGRGPQRIPLTPSPGTYDITQKRCKRTKFASNFGRPTMVPAVEVLCVPVSSYRCEKCAGICEEDFWHTNYAAFLCGVCMEEERIEHEKFRHEQLKRFKKIRTCWYKHSHEGTTAAVQLLPDHKLVKRERLENYLALYV